MHTQLHFATVSTLSDTWTIKDFWGAFKVRWGVGRFSYRMAPGLYTLGTPGEETPVFVTGNYKLSVDHLRRALRGRDAWVLVLDTKGINVWCAAGKGTFGTEELIHRLRTTGLLEKKGKKLLILPQLGAPGVSAPEVEKATGFRVVYGPILAKDIPEFLDSGLKATEQMRTVRFPLAERIKLIPIELVGLMKPALIMVGFLTLLGVFLLRGSPHLGGKAIPWGEAFLVSLITFLPILPASVLGVILFPILLPLLPGRAFSLKGAWLTLIGIGIYGLVRFGFPPPLSVVPYSFLLGGIVSFLAMNFTGSTPFTSFSGVLKEMETAVLLQILSFFVGTLWLLIDLVRKTF